MNHAERSEGMNEALPPLKPCPFCGRADTLKLTTAQEIAEEGEDDPMPWPHSGSWAVICDGSAPGGPGGCGATGGFRASRLEAVQAWSARAALEAQAEPAGWKLVPVEPTPQMLAAVRNGPMHETWMDGYRAMLAAAPQQPPQE